MPFTPPASTGGQALEIGEIIEAWADSHDLPLQGQADSTNRLVLLVLNGEEIPGEMEIVGKIAVLTVRDNPASYAIETADGGWILDESWANASSLPSVLDNALRMLRQRVKAPLAIWALAYVPPPLAQGKAR